jgi:hypothetical protein
VPQEVHCVSAVAVQAVETYWPGAQVLQATHAVCAVPSSSKVPFPQTSGGEPQAASTSMLKQVNARTPNRDRRIRRVLLIERVWDQQLRRATGIPTRAL